MSSPASRSASLEILEHAPVASTSQVPPPSMGTSQSTQIVPNSNPSSRVSEATSQISGRDPKGKQAARPRPSIISVHVEDSTSEDDDDYLDGQRRRSGSERSHDAATSRKRNRYTASSVRSRKRARNSYADSRLHRVPRDAETIEASDDEAREIAEDDVARRAMVNAAAAKRKEKASAGTPLTEQRVNALKQPKKRKISLASGSAGASSSTASRVSAPTEATSAELLVSDNDFSVRVTTQSARLAKEDRRKSNASHIANGHTVDHGSATSTKRTAQSARKTQSIPQANGVAANRHKPQRNAGLDSNDDDVVANGTPRGKRKAGDAKGQEPGTPNGTATDKRLQRQLASMKRKLDEKDDQFNELSSAHEMARAENLELRDNVKMLKAELKRKKPSYNDDSADGEDEGGQPEALQAQVERLQQDLFVLRSGSGQPGCNEYREVDELQRRHAAELKRRDEHLLRAEQAAQHTRFNTQAELNKRTAEFNEQREALRSELQAVRSEYRILQKTHADDERSRALEHQLYWAQQENTALQTQNKQLLLRHSDGSEASQKQESNGDLHAEAASTANVGLTSSESTQVRRYKQQVQQAESYITALTEQKDRHIRQLQQDLAQRDQTAHSKFKDIETARAKMENKYEAALADKARIVGDLKAAQKNEQRLFQLQPEYDRLQLANPRLHAELEEAQASNTQLTQENEALRGERLASVKFVADARSEACTLRADLARLTEQLATSRTDQEQLQARIRTSQVAGKRPQQEARQVPRTLSKPQQQGHVAPFVNGYSAHASGSDSDALGDASDEDRDTVRIVPRNTIDKAGMVNGNHSQASLPASGLATLSNGWSHSPEDEEAVMSPPASIPNDSASAQPEAAPRPAPPINPQLSALRDRAAEEGQASVGILDRLWSTSGRIQWPKLRRQRRPSTKVPEHESRIYVRSECHTPYVPGETVHDTDDEFLEWESEAYERSQLGNPDRKEALVNTCWNRHILDARGTRVRSDNLAFCGNFAQDYAAIIHKHGAKDAFVKHVLELVRLNQLTSDEGGTVVSIYHEFIAAAEG